MPTNYIYDLMTRKYFDKGNVKEINYLKFCQDVDKPEDMFPYFESLSIKKPPSPGDK